ncbi:hypothetical protein NW801_15020 [Brevibacillus laterosporus]|uniref:Uncharacterized protein n=1 Tax=Brevibacillus halotolerans TaxID=1507437 RepID=A0ABT4HZ52_9BACL|nr:hypothetical protein [Brevibacillus laterosporus]MCR8986340.1 hypothetical protein [Brevibacillus laterosporus]MCZ0832074.1 hypothetical protein [Brevibacillus halotolerans]
MIKPLTPVGGSGYETKPSYRFDYWRPTERVCKLIEKENLFCNKPSKYGIVSPDISFVVHAKPVNGEREVRVFAFTEVNPK